MKMGLDPNWAAKAACLGCDANLWHPERGDNVSGVYAVAVCNGCPVEQECLIDNLFEQTGISGGLNGEQRTAMRVAMGLRRHHRAA